MMRFPDGTERGLLLRALGALLRARVVLTVLPFSRVQDRLDRNPVASGVDNSVTAELVGWAVRIASTVVPRSTCLVQAIAAQSLLHRYGLHGELKIGVTGNPAAIEAHAWVVCGDVVVVGGSATDRYQPLSRTPAK